MDGLARVLSAAALDLTRRDPLPSVLDALLEKLARLVAYDRAGILLLEGDILVERAARGADVSAPGRRVLRLPLLDSGREIGVLAVERSGPAAFAPPDVELVEAVAAHAAAAVHRDRLDRQLQHAEERLRELSHHDALTGIPNRRLFQDRLSLAAAQAHRHRRPFAILFLDLDRFKVINDSLGHSAGDRLLQAVAQRLRACLREGDTVARLGGDEFTLMLPGIEQAVDAAKVATKVLDAVRAPYEIDGRELVVTGSIGVSVYPDDGQDAEALLKNADTAMYRAKEQGRDNYQLYTPAMNDTALERLALEGHLRKALSHDELVLHYQPIFDRTGHVHAVEALLRWHHPERGLLPPAEFIPLAELTGLILPMGPWVLRSACAQAWVWQERHPGLGVAVNLSPRQFQEPLLVGQVADALDDTGLAPHLLQLEITETSAMQNAPAAVETLRKLKDLGVRLSIDDFGTGYSSLSYLRRFPIDTLKIDRSFIRDIEGDAGAEAIARGLVALAHTLKLDVVAEGVETKGQLEVMAASGCDRMQGYLLSPPVPAERCQQLLPRMLVVPAR